MKVSWLVLVLLVTIFGCRKELTEVEQNSNQEHADALAPYVRSIQEQTLEVIAQHRWLKRRLEKCIETLEAQHGLEPIPIEYPEREFLKSFPRRKTDPNSMYTRPPEPFYLPYENPNPPVWPVDKQHDIKTLIALLRLQSISIKLYMSSADDWIENFEKRLERLEGHLEK